jgi:hypothetical protein
MVIGIGPLTTAAVLCGSFLGAQEIRRDQMSDDQLVAQANAQHVTGWLQAVDRVTPGQYKNLESFEALPDGAHVRADSESWSARFFTPKFDPYRQTEPVKRSFHNAGADTYDMLRHQYAAQSLSLEVIETVTFTLLRFGPSKSLLSLPEENKRKAIMRAASAVLHLPDDFQFPAPVIEGALFSTHAEANPITLRSWTARVDGGIHNGQLFFICYKRQEPADGKLIFLNGQHWFDGKCWEMAGHAGKP